MRRSSTSSAERGRVQAPDRAVQRDRGRRERRRQALRRHHLHGVARRDVVLDAVHRGAEFLLREAGDEAAVPAAAPRPRRRHPQRLAQLRLDGVEPLARALQVRRRRRVGVHAERERGAQVVEHDQLVGAHQQDVGRAERVGLAALEPGLEIPHAVVAEVPDQAAGQARQAGHGLVAETRGVLAQPRQRVGELGGLDDTALAPHLGAAAMDAQDFAARQADEGVAPETLAALHRVQQVGIGRVGELEVGADGRVEVARQLAGEDDAVVCGQSRTRASCSRMALIVAL